MKNYIKQSNSNLKFSNGYERAGKRTCRRIQR